jgi:prepilin-type N-terminal cleavage/methylation domain-containing protein
MKKTMPVGRQAFTLLELLVAAGVISFLSVIITQILFSSIHLNTKTEVIKELKQTGDMTLDSISRMIQNAALIQCDSIDTTYITITGADGRITNINCVDDADGITRIASSSASFSYLTNNNVTLIDGSGQSGCLNSPLTFTCAETGGIPTSVTVLFRLRQKNLLATSYEAAMELFQATISVRNSTNE